MTATIRPASLSRRLAAGAYDLLLVAGLLVTSGFVVVIARHGTPVPAGQPLFQALIAAEVLAYFTGFWRWGGQTPAMRVWGLRLLPVPGGRITVTTSLVRFCAALLSGIALGAGFLAALADSEHRTWHDRLSGTRLVQVSLPRRRRRVSGSAAEAREPPAPVQSSE